MRGKDTAGGCPGGVADQGDDAEEARPSAEALVAATLALMTGVVERAALAQPLSAHGQSQLMAAKVRSNLFMLAHHEQLSDAFRATIGRLSGHWDRLAMPARRGCGWGEPAAPAVCDWHATPGRLQ